MTIKISQMPDINGRNSKSRATEAPGRKRVGPSKSLRAQRKRHARINEARDRAGVLQAAGRMCSIFFRSSACNYVQRVFACPDNHINLKLGARKFS